MTITCDRWKEIAFSSEYYRSGQKVLVRLGEKTADGGPINGIEDLPGKKVCAPNGSTSMDKLRTFKGLEAGRRRHPHRLPGAVPGGRGRRHHRRRHGARRPGRPGPLRRGRPGAGLHRRALRAGCQQGRTSTSCASSTACSRRCKRRRPAGPASYNTWLADALGKAPAPPQPVYGRTPMIAAPASATAPTRPGPARPGAGRPRTPLRYLEALGTWRDDAQGASSTCSTRPPSGRRTQAASPTTCCSRWRCGRPSPTATTCWWRPGTPVGSAPTELERLSTLVWGRLDATPRTAASAQVLPRQVPTGALGRLAARGLPALRRAGRLAARPAGLDPSEADTKHACAQLRAAVERVRDLVDREPASTHDAARARCSTSSTPASPTCRPGPSRGADVGGLLGPLENDAARAERDLIVGAANRRADAHDEARARALRAELEARGAALRDLAARCVAEVTPAPRLRRARRRRRSGRSPPSRRPWTPTWSGWTPSAAR